MAQLFTNNAYSALAANINNSATTLTLTTGTGLRFPTPAGSDFFLLTLIGLDGNGNENSWEIVKVTARSNDTLTVTRAQESTTAASWNAGTRVELRTTAGTLDTFTDATEAAAAAPVQSVAGRTGAVTLTKSDVGLGNVENKNSATILGEITSSNVTTALGYTPVNPNVIGAASGIAPLGSDSKIAATYLPSYVDDVLEYANLAGFPGTGVTGVIYVALDTGKIYRWSGSAYVEISASPGSTDAVTEGSTNLYFTNARARSAISATQNLTYNSSTGVITGPDLSVYLTSATAASTYQTQAGMSSYAALSGATFTGTVIHSDALLTRAMFQDTGWDYFDSTTTAALNYTNGSVQRWAPTASSNPTLSISNWPPSGAMGELLIEAVNLGAAGTITFPNANWVKSDGTFAASPSAAGVTLQSSGTDFILFWTRDAGTTLYAKVVR